VRSALHRGLAGFGESARFLQGRGAATHGAPKIPDFNLLILQDSGFSRVRKISALAAKGVWI